MAAKKKPHGSEVLPRHWKASLRDTLLLLSEFRGPLLFFTHQSQMHPSDSRVVTSGDMLGVLGGPEQLSHLLHDNE